MRCTKCALLLVAMSFFASGAAAQEKAESRVSADGLGSLSLKPTLMRVHIELVGRGKDLKSAMASLRDRRDAVKIQLEGMKADMKYVKIGSPTLAGGSGQQEQQVRALIMERARQRGGSKVELPVIVSVSAPLTAQWALTSTDDDARLLEVGQLQDKIAAADLGGLKDKQALTPEQQELQEEIAQMSNRYGGEQTVAGQPQYIFVAPVTEKQATDLYASAFAQAKKKGQRLAQSAGATLGPVQGVGSSAMSELGDESPGQYSPQYYYMLRAQARSMARQTGATGEEDVIEAYGTDPNNVKYQVAVNCIFGLK